MSALQTSVESTKIKTIKNRCVHAKIEIEGCLYRCVSFFVDTPIKAKEEDWSVFKLEDNNKILIDKLTLAVMAECESEFLTRDSDKKMNEPPIVAVELRMFEAETPPQSPKNGVEVGRRRWGEVE
jgi:hypothetical protein